MPGIHVIGKQASFSCQLLDRSHLYIIYVVFVYIYLRLLHDHYTLRTAKEAMSIKIEKRSLVGIVLLEVLFVVKRGW